MQSCPTLGAVVLEQGLKYRSLVWVFGSREGREENEVNQLLWVPTEEKGMVYEVSQSVSQILPIQLPIFLLTEVWLLQLRSSVATDHYLVSKRRGDQHSKGPNRGSVAQLWGKGVP